MAAVIAMISWDDAETLFHEFGHAEAYRQFRGREAAEARFPGGAALEVTER